MLPGNYQFTGPSYKKGKREGQALGEANAVVTVLKTRGIVPVVTEVKRAGGVPVVGTLAEAHGAVELAVLSAMAHGRGDVDIAVKIALTVAGATEGLDPDRRALYSDMVMAALSEAARKALEMLPQGYEFQYEPYRRAQLTSKAEDVLDVLGARGVAVSDAERERIVACRDLETLRRWVRRAATVSRAEELFVD
jgi:hypothetical protein